MTGTHSRGAALVAALLWIGAGCHSSDTAEDPARGETEEQSAESRGVVDLAVDVATRARAAREDAAGDEVDSVVRAGVKRGDDDDDEDASQAKDGAAADEANEGGGVRLSESQRREYGIAVEEAEGSTIESSVELPGEIHANASRLARLVPRFAGIVIEVRKQEGEWVEKGEALARIESNESLSQFELRTPIAGRIVERNVVPGEIASAERPAFVVADLKTVWVDLGVFQKDLAVIQVGQSVRIHAEPGIGDAVGTISYLAPMLSETTRTATARVVLPNPDGRWRPGLFVTGAVVVGEAQARVSVPLDAVQQLNEKTVVFVEEAEELQPREVSLGLRDRTQVEVLAGLVPGDRFVAQGAFLLRSELQKEAFGDDDD